MQHSNYLFVYGSLRSGFKSSAYEYITKYFTFVAHSKARGILYNLGTHPVAKPTTDDKFIVGELYVVSNPNFASYAFAQLDDYEGIEVEENTIPEYIKSLTEVEVDEQVFIATVYWYNGNTSHAPIIESGDVMDFKGL